MPDLLAGWARRKILPPAGYPMAGYVARKGASRGSLSPLYVRALVLRQGKRTVAIFVADVLLFSSGWARRVRKLVSCALGVSPECIVVAATHTHSGPLVDTSPFDIHGGPTDPRLPAFMRRVEQACCAAAIEAKRRSDPVFVAAGRVAVSGVASDRNRPKLGHEQSFFLLRFDGRRGSAVLGIYGCHPTVLGASNRLFSGDLHGEIARRLERRMNCALIANGAAANISTRFTRKSASRAEICRLASRILKQISGASLRPHAQSRLALRSRWLRLPLRNLQAEVPSAGKKSGRLAVVAEEARLMRQRLQQAKELSGSRLRLAITGLRIGPILLAALPFELYSTTGDFLWEKARMIPLCYANGYWGYVPGPTAATGDYEVVSSPFPAAADPLLRQTLLKLATLI